MMRWIWMTWAAARKINSRIKHRRKRKAPNNNRQFPTVKSQGQRTMRMAKMTRRCPAPTIPQSMPTCRCLRMSRSCSNTSRGTSPKSWISILSWSHSFPTTCRQLEKSTHASKCKSQTEPRRTLVSHSWTSQLWTARTRLSWSLSMSKVRTLVERRQWQWTQ